MKTSDQPSNTKINASEIPQTVFFTACRGVFAGGGCRAAAHIGAYEAATLAGVNFSEIAGTSAGSIIAALVGAGASPDFLRQHSNAKFFSKLLSKPTGTSIKTGLLGAILKALPFTRRVLMGRIVMYGGAYSSNKLEEWIDDRLAELLPQASRPVKFSTLLLPTTIVATDLAGGRPKVWSSITTPDESVALAVRCSCSIPLFFEPVPIGNSLFVDGGLLSNLPTFVFAGSPSSPNLGGRILAFSLEENSKPPTKWGHSELLHSLAETVVGGATALQTSMQSEVNVITIPTGDVRATDFNMTDEQVSVLITNGRNAVFDFIRNEAIHLRSKLGTDSWYVDEDNFLAEMVQEARTPGKSFVATMPDTRWFWQLFPTILAWRAAGSSLKVIVEPLRGSSDEQARETQRRNLLTGLGARVYEQKDLPFCGFLLTGTDEHWDAAFVRNPRQMEYAAYGTAYAGAHHLPLLRIIKQSLENVIQPIQNELEACELRNHSSNEIIRLLKVGVWQYTPTRVQISLEEVPLRRVQMLVRRIRTFKFNQISQLSELYRKFNLPLFVPAAVVLQDKIVSVITPPVLEEWGSNLIAVEGNTRIYHMNKEGSTAIHALIVRGVTEPLPGRPVWPKEALLYTRSLESSERISGFNYNQFRSVEGSARPLSPKDNRNAKA